MPKMKTKKSAVYRFKRTGTGKFLRYRSMAGHLMTGKSSKRKRNLRRATLVHRSDIKLVKRLLPK
ncbi:MAG: 50S ribosomal protein L35 [bacterium]